MPPFAGAVHETSSRLATVEVTVGFTGAAGFVVAVTDPDVAAGPDPTELDGVIVKVYDVPEANPSKVKLVEVVVFETVVGVVVIVYNEAAGDVAGKDHDKLTAPPWPFVPVAVNK